MSAKPARTVEYLEHMLDAIERSEAYAVGFDWPAFDADPRTQGAVIRNLEVMGRRREMSFGMIQIS